MIVATCVTYFILRDQHVLIWHPLSILRRYSLFSFMAPFILMGPAYLCAAVACGLHCSTFYQIRTGVRMIALAVTTTVPLSIWAYIIGRSGIITDTGQPIELIVPMVIVPAVILIISAAWVALRRQSIWAPAYRQFHSLFFGNKIQHNDAS